MNGSSSRTIRSTFEKIDPNQAIVGIPATPLIRCLCFGAAALLLVGTIGIAYSAFAIFDVLWSHSVIAALMVLAGIVAGLSGAFISFRAGAKAGTDFSFLVDSTGVSYRFNNDIRQIRWTDISRNPSKGFDVDSGSGGGEEQIIASWVYG